MPTTCASGSIDGRHEERAGVAERPISTSPRAARAQAEADFARRLRIALAHCDAGMTELAQRLGVGRKRLYQALEPDSGRPFHAAWLPLLPEDVRLALARADAGDMGMELVPVAVLAQSRDDAGQLSRLIAELSDVMRCAAESQADGVITPAEARAELLEIAEAEEILAHRRARLREAAMVMPLRAAGGR
jgi:hypothetical protein